jgi:hypothetical protein
MQLGQRTKKLARHRPCWTEGDLVISAARVTGHENLPSGPYITPSAGFGKCAVTPKSFAITLVGFPSLYPWIHEQPTSIFTPSLDQVLARPPTRSRASRTKTEWPFAVSSRAAAADDQPAPMRIVSKIFCVMVV